MKEAHLNIKSHPTLSETLSRLWNNLPSLWKVLIPVLGALLVVLLPANVLISSRFYAITTENLRAQHQALLADLGNAFDEFFSKQTLYLVTLANSDTIKACAASGCTAEAQAVFVPELTARLHEAGVYYVEIGFLDASGKETARAMRGSGGVVVSPGEGALFNADPNALRGTAIGQAYVFPISRDTRISAVESYQQPVVRLAVPVSTSGSVQGYVTAVLNLDDFFAQYFVPSDEQQTFLLDTDKCLLATSDDTRRAETYKTWSGDPARTCYADLQLEEWDTTVQRYHDTIISTRVIHGPLTTSGQTWTIVVQEPAARAYGQANTLHTLLTAAHLIATLLVMLFIVGANRATARLLNAARSLSAEHARDIRFNPYVVGPPIEDPLRFFGRTQALARVIGAGMTGGDTVLIDGDRRIGKTSLLRQIERRLREQKVTDPAYWYWPVWLSLQGITADVFYATLMDTILRDMPDHRTRTDLRYHKRQAGYAVEDFREDITEILALPNAAGRQTRLVLCLDNAHVWFGSTSGYDAAFVETFDAMLRAIGNPLKLIATGTHIPDGAFGPTSTVIPLGPLSADEAERLIRQPVARIYRFEDEAVMRIIAESNALPLEVQRLTRYAVQTMLEQDAESVTVTHVERALRRALDDWEPTYRLLWNGGTDKSGIRVERFSDELRATLLDLAARDGALPPSLWAQSPQARAQFDDVAYTDAQGEVRLTALFRAWLTQSNRVSISS
jgi:hypothetical protein